MKPYLLETKYEFLSLLRMPRFVVGTLVIPAMFYIFFGLLMASKMSHGENVKLASFLLSTYGTFGVMGAALYSLGAGVASERTLGWLEVKRASPMPPLAYFTAKVAGAMGFATIIVALLFTLGFIFGGVRMAAPQWILLAVTLIAGALPFCALGLAIGYFATANSAPAFVNMIYLPMAFFSGLWVPLQFLPDAMQKIAVALPAYHLAQIGLIVTGVAHDSVAVHIQALVATAMICSGLAWILFRREEKKAYG